MRKPINKSDIQEVINAMNTSWYWDCKYCEFDSCYNDESGEYDEYYNCNNPDNKARFCKLFHNKECDLFEEN